jgi:Ca2+-binding EF-hand superfamily protein
MAASRFGRRPLVVLALLALALDADAQKGGHRRARPGGHGGAAPRDDFGTNPGADSGAPPAPTPFLPGFGPEPGTEKKPGKGGKPPAKPAPKKPEAPKPPDPMHAADEVTALADHQTRLKDAEERLVLEHFRLCDLDGNGWISLREAEVTLSFDRAEYKRTDANADGRLDLTEFSAQRDTILARLGAHPVDEGPVGPEVSAAGGPAPAVEVPKPEPAPAAPTPIAPAKPKPNALQSELGSMSVMPGMLLRRFDADKSKGLDATELEQAVTQLGLTFSCSQALEVLDRNDSAQLEVSELLPLAWMASQAHPAAAPPPPTAQPLEAAPAEPALAITPPLPAPASPTDGAKVTHFARLDPGHDGFIDESDLRVLQGPARLDLRVKAVLSAMDADGDGRLSESEFHAAMAAPPR